MGAEKRMKIGVQMTAALHRDLAADAKRRGMKLYEAIEQAIELYLGRSKPGVDPRYRIPSDILPYLDTLAGLLASGEADIISGVTQNLDLFEQLRAAREAHKRH